MLTRIKCILSALPHVIGTVVLAVLLVALLNGSSCHYSSCHKKHHSDHDHDHHDCHNHVTSDSWWSPRRTTRGVPAASESRSELDADPGDRTDGHGAGTGAYLADPAAYRLTKFTLIAGKAGGDTPFQILTKFQGISLLALGGGNLNSTEVLRMATERLLLANPQLFGSSGDAVDFSFARVRFLEEAIEVYYRRWKADADPSHEASEVLFVFDRQGGLARVEIGPRASVAPVQRAD